MNKGKSPIKDKYTSTPLIHPPPMKTSSIVSNETVTSSIQLDHAHKQKSNINHKSVQQQIKKAQILCQSIKKFTNNDKTSNENGETPRDPFNKVRQHGNLIDNKYLFKQLNIKVNSGSIELPKTPRLNNEAPKSICFSSPVCAQSQKLKGNMQLSPKKRENSKKISPKKKSNISNPDSEGNPHNFQTAHEIESFFLDQDEDDPLQMSIVEEHGTGVLNWNICQGKASQFKILKFIDEGRFGKVYLAQSYRNGMVYSIKTLYRSSLDADTFQQLIRQVKIQSFLNHPSIVKLYHFFVDEESAYLVLEPCLGNNLYQKLKQSGKMSEKVVREYIRQVCTAVEYMHKNDIIHRDLKPENILLHENTIKICDFGWAVYSPLLRATQCGTPVYTSPEIVKKLPYDSKIDIWSIGILTYELLYGTIPFEIRHIDDLLKITEQQVYFQQETMVSQAAKDFMSGCLQKNPNKRYSIRQLLQHEFLFKMDIYRRTIA